MPINSDTSCKKNCNHFLDLSFLCLIRLKVLIRFEWHNQTMKIEIKKIECLLCFNEMTLRVFLQQGITSLIYITSIQQSLQYVTYFPIHWIMKQHVPSGKCMLYSSFLKWHSIQRWKVNLNITNPRGVPDDHTQIFLPLQQSTDSCFLNLSANWSARNSCEFLFMFLRSNKF